MEIIKREIVEVICEGVKHIQDDNNDMLIDDMGVEVFITKIDSTGSHTWILSKELAQKLKESL